MSLWQHLRTIPPYLVEVFVRSKAAWGGGAVIIAVSIIEHAMGRSLPGIGYAMALMLAVIGAQFWHGLMQFERMQPRIKISPLKQHFWTLEEKRGSTGTGWYFEVSNTSAAQVLESVRAQLISLEPDEIGILPLPLHIRHKDWQTAEVSINPGSSEQFDIATGPDHNVTSQSRIEIPCIVGGDRGYVNAARIPAARYRLTIRVTAKTCRPQHVSFDLWIEDNFLRCIEHQASAQEAI